MTDGPMEVQAGSYVELKIRLPLELLKSYRHSFSLNFGVSQSMQSPIRILSSIHAQEGTASRRNQIDRNDVTEFAERIG